VQYQKQKAQLLKMAKLKSVNLYQQKSVAVAVLALALVLALANDIKSVSIGIVNSSEQLIVDC
jgi:hypothetical protein